MGVGIYHRFADQPFSIRRSGQPYVEECRENTTEERQGCALIVENKRVWPGHAISLEAITCVTKPKRYCSIPRVVDSGT
jgi:hypothetical protein